MLSSDYSTRRTANLLLQTCINVHRLPISNCLSRKKALGLCLCLHREGIDNDQCHQACQVNIPVTSNLLFHFAVPSGPFLKSLSPHFVVHLCCTHHLLLLPKHSPSLYCFPSLCPVLLLKLPNCQPFLFIQSPMNAPHCSSPSISMLESFLDPPKFSCVTLHRSSC